MEGKPIPFEGTAETLAIQSFEQSDSMLEFFMSLNPEQQRRFAEIAHNLVLIGFEKGREPITNPSIELQAASGIRKFELYLDGVREGDDILEEFYDDEL
jgi:hypothetical protein